MVSSALDSAARAEELGLRGERIVPPRQGERRAGLIAVYRELARPLRLSLHLGLTEAGMGTKGIRRSTAALGVLLQEASAYTIASRSRPTRAETARARSSSRRSCCRPWPALVLALVIACPGCGRTTSTTFQELAAKIQRFLREQMPRWRERFPGSRTCTSR